MSNEDTQPPTPEEPELTPEEAEEAQHAELLKKWARSATARGYTVIFIHPDGRREIHRPNKPEPPTDDTHEDNY